MSEKLKIRGTETLDHPGGLVASREGALRFGRQNMPKDLARAGFACSVARGFYGDYWVINYSK